ncbi:MAG: ATP-binding protein [Gammaproteobacteria bacterium]
MYLPRALKISLQHAASSFPTVLVTGPRQSGKTTFLRHEFGGQSEYVSFDDPLNRGFALSDPNGFLNQFHSKQVILDEIQYVPELFPYIKMRIDNQPEMTGQWLLTGFQQFQLMHNLTESLAGRVAILELLPFALTELPDRTLAEMIWQGGYPIPALHKERLRLWMSGYIQTYLERDVRQLINVQDLHRFETFVNLCAARHGQIFHASDLARDVGISQPTVKSWASVLEAAYVIRQIFPWFRNYGKRLVKSPKLYFLDPALVCTLTRQPAPEAALSGAMGGALFEGLILSEAVKAFTNAGKIPEVYYWRTRDGMEVDLLIALGSRALPVEIKLTATPTTKHVQPLTRMCRMPGDDIHPTGVLVCQCQKQTLMPGGHTAIPWKEFSPWLNKQIQEPQPCP